MQQVLDFVGLVSALNTLDGLNSGVGPRVLFRIYIYIYNIQLNKRLCERFSRAFLRSVCFTFSGHVFAALPGSGLFSRLLDVCLRVGPRMYYVHTCPETFSFYNYPEVLLPVFGTVFLAFSGLGRGSIENPKKKNITRFFSN